MSNNTNHSLTFNDYSKIVDETCIVDPALLPFYAPLGLVGETGELAAYGANTAAAAGEKLAENILTAATLLGEIAEAVKKSRYRKDKTNPEEVQATVIGACLDLVELAMRIGFEIAPKEESVIREDTLDVVNGTYSDLQGNVLVSKQPEGLQAKEAGDVLWYLAACGKAMGFSLDEAASGNMTKLRRRLEEGKIQGSGSTR